MPPADLGRELRRGATSLGVHLGADRVDTLLAFLALLERWNRAYNLTAVRDPRQMVSRHLLDSLSIAGLVRGPRVLDVGSGAGLPGLVLAAALPGLEVTLLDASLKRTRFLSHAARSLGLGSVRVVRERAETHRPQEPYDTLVSRAALSLERLVGLASGLLRPGGRLVAMLGGAPEASVSHRLSVRVIPLAVPGSEAQRHAAVLDLR